MWRIHIKRKELWNFLFWHISLLIVTKLIMYCYFRVYFPLFYLDVTSFQGQNGLNSVIIKLRLTLFNSLYIIGNLVDDFYWVFYVDFLWSLILPCDFDIRMVFFWLTVVSSLLSFEVLIDSSFVDKSTDFVDKNLRPQMSLWSPGSPLKLFCRSFKVIWSVNNYCTDDIRGSVVGYRPSVLLQGSHRSTTV